MLAQLRFCEYRCENEAVRREYGRGKRGAAAEHDEFQPYQQAKTAIVHELTEQARKVGYADALPDVGFR